MLPSGLPKFVGDDEPLARFLTSEGQFNRDFAKAPAFMPGPADSKTSVFRHYSDDLDTLWAVADAELGASRRVRAAAFVTAAQVRKALLDVEAEEPPPRHANIFGWPAVGDDPDHFKALCKAFALSLAQVATLHRR